MSNFPLRPRRRLRARVVFWMMSGMVIGNLTTFYGFGPDFNPTWMRNWFVIDGP